MSDVLIIEDHPFVAQATKELIERAHPSLLTTVCSTTESALRAMRDPARSWHRILLDLDVPGAHGLSFALQIERLGFAPITCIVTAMERRDFIARVKSLGFLGYVLKAMPATDFATGLGRVFAGTRVFPGREQPRTPSATVRLTRRQTEVLSLVSRGFSSKQIASRLVLSEGTVNNHMNATMGVLNASTRSQAVATAIALGLLEPAHQFDGSTEDCR